MRLALLLLLGLGPDDGVQAAAAESSVMLLVVLLLLLLLLLLLPTFSSSHACCNSCMVWALGAGKRRWAVSIS